MVNIAAALWNNAINRPDAIALRAREEEWTYGRLKGLAAAFGGALRAAGINSRDRVLLVAPSVPEFVVAYMGAHLRGAVVITMNTMATAAEIGYVLDDSDAALVIAWHEVTASAERAAGERGRPFWVLEHGAESDADPLTEPVDLAPDDTAILLYTSGTTGKPKGVELTVSNVDSTTRRLIDQLGFTTEDRVGTGLPLFHIFGQALIMNPVLHLGASLSLLSPFHPEHMLEMLRRDRLTAMAGVPTMWNAMLHAAGEYGPDDFTSLRLAASGGASLPAEVVRAFTERFGCEILEGYGLTETTGSATFNPAGREPKIGSVGLALPGTSIEVRDSSGEVSPAGEVGELYLKGHGIMKGYWNRPEATAADLQDGWLKTGDLGRVDEDGYVYIVGRAKDMIIRGGYNVYPNEVEEVFYGHPGIAEVAVIGVPHDHYGEEVAAVIVTVDGVSLDPDDLRAWAKEQLSAYKVPHLFAFADELPKGATGKILKRAIDWESVSSN